MTRAIETTGGRERWRQIYLTVLVARLVGLHTVHANSSQSLKEK